MIHIFLTFCIKTTRYAFKISTVLTFCIKIPFFQSEHKYRARHMWMFLAGNRDGESQARQFLDIREGGSLAPRQRGRRLPRELSSPSKHGGTPLPQRKPKGGVPNIQQCRTHHPRVGRSSTQPRASQERNQGTRHDAQNTRVGESSAVSNFGQASWEDVKVVCVLLSHLYSS